MKLIALIVTASVAALCQQVPESESPPATFRSGVSNVKIDVQVTKDRALVSDLKLGDFQLFDQDRQTELLFADRGAEPLSLVLLLDVSGSMRKHLEAIAAVAVDSLRFLHPSDTVAVIVFGKVAKTRLELTADRQKVEAEIKAAVNDKDVGAETAINDAIVSGANYLDKDSSTGRRAILILTDNFGLNVRNPDEKVIERLLATNCVLNAIVVGNKSHPDPGKPRPTARAAETLPNVYYIAEETGGEAVQVEDASSAFPSMIERIRLRYSLQYKTPPGVAGMFRKVRVELAPAAKMRYPEAKLHYRRGYYYSR